MSRVYVFLPQSVKTDKLIKKANEVLRDHFRGTLKISQHGKNFWTVSFREMDYTSPHFEFTLVCRHKKIIFIPPQRNSDMMIMKWVFLNFTREIAKEFDGEISDEQNPDQKIDPNRFLHLTFEAYVRAFGKNATEGTVNDVLRANQSFLETVGLQKVSQ